MERHSREAWRAIVEAKTLPRDGTGATIEIDGRRLAVFWIDDRPHVLDDECPHRGASLGLGVCVGGDVTCPWHGWHFSLATGANTDGLACVVRVFAARVREDGWIEVDLDARAARP